VPRGGAHHPGISFADHDIKLPTGPVSTGVGFTGLAGDADRDHQRRRLHRPGVRNPHSVSLPRSSIAARSLSAIEGLIGPAHPRHAGRGATAPANFRNWIVPYRITPRSSAGISVRLSNSGEQYATTLDLSTEPR
jgi:hypothetical protein